MRNSLMKINSAKCNVCSDILYARSPYDSRYCSCGAVLIVGDIVLSNKATRIELDIPYTQEEIFNDWNLELENLGHILGYEIDCRNQESITLHRTPG